MNFGTCVHCSHPIREGAIHVYAKSRARAHLACVSQPSAAATDALLVALQPARRRGAAC